MKKRGLIAVFAITAALIMLLPAVASGADSSSRPFNDVTKTQWYYNDVYNSFNNGVFKGTSQTTFSPQAPVTRGMFVTVLYRLTGSPYVYGSPGYSDIDPGAYYAPAVNWASKQGIAEGYPEGTFCPDNNLTREQAAKILYNYSALYRTTGASSSIAGRGFTDAYLVSDWAKECLAWANDEGFINGREAYGQYSLAPQDTLSRAEACAILNRYSVRYDGAVMQDYKDHIDYASLAYLDNTKVDYWFGTQYDAMNRPLEPLRFQSAEGSAANAMAIDPGGRKVIYLTFDEGYEAGYTARILDVLAAKNVQAVFFITGSYYRSSKWLVARMINEGHIVGNHSNSHPEKGMQSLSLQKQFEDIDTLQNYLRNDFDYEMTLFRSPAGIYSAQSMALVSAMHMKSVFWSFGYGDYDTSKQPAQATALAKLKDRLHPGAVYLLHAVSATNTNILGQFIDYARSRGYTFELVTN